MGESSDVLVVRFSDTSVAPISISLTGECLGMPVTVTPARLDFDTCRCGLSYATKATLRNSGDSPALVAVKVPKAVRAYVTVQPAQFTVPPQGSFAANITFKPTADLVTASRAANKQNSEGVASVTVPFEAELEVVVEGQVCPPCSKDSFSSCLLSWRSLLL